MYDRSRREGRHSSESEGSSGSPGKRTLAERASSGAPLPGSLKDRAEASTGADLSGVRVHAGPEDAADAASIGARAFTVGSDVVFGAGQYAPGTPGGDVLIAHELVHAVQQQGAAPAAQTKLEVTGRGDAAEVEADRLAPALLAGAPVTVSERPGAQLARAEYDEELYGSQDPEILDGSKFGASKYRERIGKGGKWDPPALQAASKSGGTPLNGATLDKAELMDVIKTAQGGDAALDALLGTGDERTTRERKLADYLDKTNEALSIMAIDTVESYSMFIAHAAGETAMSVMTEGQTNKYEDDPQINGTDPNGPIQYAKPTHTGRGTIDPEKRGGNIAAHEWDRTFIGRGPIQVTHDYNYVRTIVYLEERAAQLRAEGNDADADKCQECADAVKQDPAAAAQPEYAFLFSASMMHHSGMAKQSAGFGAQVSSQQLGAKFTGGHKDHQSPKKEAAYKRCHELLSAKVKAQPAAATAPAE